MRKTIFCFVLAVLALSAQAKVGYLLTSNTINELPAERYNNVDQQPERNAATWFQTEYVNKDKGTFISLSEMAKGIDVNNIAVLWVNVDRVGLKSLEEAGFSNQVITAIGNYIKQGGNVYLTKQANQIAYKIGRMGYAPSWSSGNYTDGTDVWSINATLGTSTSKSYDRSAHQVFTNLDVSYTYAHTSYPMVGAVARTDNNNMWIDMFRKDPNTGGQMAEGANTHYDNSNPARLEDFESDWNCQVLAVWGQVTDYCAPGIIEFNPHGDFKGIVLTNGFAAYQWGNSNNYLDNVKLLTKNALDYLQGIEPPAPAPVPAETRIWMPMELKSGKLKESVSNSNININSVHAPITAKGAVGNALRTDGYSTYVTVPTNNANLNNNALTFSLWCAVQTYPMMVIDIAENKFSSIAGNLNDDARTGFAFRLSSQGNFAFECYVNGWKVTVNSSEKLPVNQWNRLVATMDTNGKSIKLYNNGRLLGQSNINGNINAGTSELIIGKSRENVEAFGCLLNTFNGIIDEVKVDNYIWSESEIKTTPTPENKVDFSLPVGYWENDPYRPQFHGMPEMNWTNETHGLTYWDGKYHAFFQKNGNGPYMSRLHWGHITSTNLLDWKEEYIAIYPLNNYDLKGCWSGAVFNDQIITGGKPWIIYTGVDNARASMNLASPADDGLIKWNKAGNNPRIAGIPGGYSSDFRDPYFFRNGNDAYMIVGGSINNVGTTLLFKYDNGNWIHKGEFFTGVNSATCGTFFEMPNITPMGNGKWLFTATPLAGNTGVKTLYWVGTINADGRFVPFEQNPKTVELVGFAKDGYGLLSPSIYTEANRTIALGIVPDKLPTGDNIDMGWSHTYSLPREWSLDANNNLIQKPVKEVEAYRSDAVNFSKSAFTLNGTQSLGDVKGRHLEICAQFKLASSEVGMRVLKNAYGSVKISFNPLTQEFIVDMTSVNRKVNDSHLFNGRYVSSLPELVRSGSTLKLDVFVDNSIIDIFINDKWATSVRVFSKEYNANGAEIYTTGNTEVISVNAWNLQKEEVETAIGETNEEMAAPLYYNNQTIYYDFAETSLVELYDLMGKKLQSFENVSGQGTLPFAYRGVFIAVVNKENAYKQIAF